MRKILITGGGLVNKGAQAMTFICVDAMKKRYPDHEIVLLSNVDAERPAKEREKYTFSIAREGSLNCAFYRLGGIYRTLAKLRNHDEQAQKQADELYSNADILIDVSGYVLGSNWSNEFCVEFLTRFVYAEAYNIKAYVMPQSFGPFEFHGKTGKIIEWMIRRFLSKAEVVYAREEEGYRGLTEKYKLKNLKKSNDMVLVNKGVDPNSVFKQVPVEQELDIPRESVAVIPNRKVTQYINIDYKELYYSLIDDLLFKGKRVILVQHSEHDSEICKQLSQHYKDDLRVLQIEELNCIEFEHIVSQFDYMIASRYHSIIHAYKKGVPSVILAWTDKYQELAASMDQGAYLIDTRKCELRLILQTVDRMNESFSAEKKKILAKYQMVQTSDLFDSITI